MVQLRLSYLCRVPTQTDLKGIWHRALLTGAASGIGQALAQRLAAVGVDLVLVDKHTEVIDIPTAEIMQADLCDPADLAKVEQRLISAQAPVDLVINNAGLGYECPFWQQERAEVDETLGLNVIALTQLTHSAVRALVERGGGQVVLVSSVASLQPIPNIAVYAASKAFVSSLGEALYEEHKGTGVAITTVMPGLTRTNFHERGRWNLDNWPSVGWQSPKAVASEALHAAARSRPVVITGRLNRFYGVLTTKAPRSLRRFILGRSARRAMAQNL